jgi:hypothetical protein
MDIEESLSTLRNINGVLEYFGSDPVDWTGEYFGSDPVDWTGYK